MQVSHVHRITSCETHLVCWVGFFVVVLNVSVQHRAFTSALALPNAVWPFFVSIRESALARPGRQYLAFVFVCVCVCVKEMRPRSFFFMLFYYCYNHVCACDQIVLPCV